MNIVAISVAPCEICGKKRGHLIEKYNGLVPVYCKCDLWDKEKNLPILARYFAMAVFMALVQSGNQYQTIRKKMAFGGIPHISLAHLSGKFCYKLLNKNMSNAITISRATADESVVTKEIYELLEEDGNKYRLLGTATGVSMDHCVVLGSEHKENFWEMVYGYKIIQNETMEKIIVEATKNINPEIQSYMTVSFFECLAEERISWVPRRLQIPDRPELSNFPLNILFSTVCTGDNNTRTVELAEYVPDLSTFVENEAKQTMKYYNRLDGARHYWTEIVYDTARKSYFGTKYCDDESAGAAYGRDWNNFFVHLTMLGV
ncbi:MAG: hypothetical protein UV02_C0067G0005 [Candidatus Kuenenbacteria bacterium GW2011_GWA2_42_15]|uniref:Uncharacterized protein n=2 Tax=Candidatus Kueneniibacteriota TaxID=1752740 RepID=A0A0G0YS95_9BACT|nr:MAG: hypothetical protein UV02_C0067G0005 [Candidatus Kuenenbacteria bacterium GW2011_GWA2_42_15]